MITKTEKQLPKLTKKPNQTMPQRAKGQKHLPLKKKTQKAKYPHTPRVAPVPFDGTLDF